MITVYVIKSKDGYRYSGITHNLTDRIKRHNGKRSKSTKGHEEYKTILIEKHKTYAEARVREKFLKSGAGRRFLDTLQ